MTAPHLSRQTWANAREGYALAKVPTVTYTDHRPYAFDIGQEVVVIKHDSPLEGMIGRVTYRSNGKPNKYHVRIDTGAITPVYPFKEDELEAYRALPIVAGARIMVFGRILKADDPAALRLLGRQLEHQRRVARKRIKTAAVIELPKWSQTTARAATAPLLREARLSKLYQHMDERRRAWLVAQERRAA